MQEINQWLKSNRSYDAGIQLYNQYGSHPLLKKLFAEAYSEFKKQKLEQVLTDLIGKTPGSVPTIPAKPTISTHSLPFHLPKVPANSKAIKAIKEDIADIKDDTVYLQDQVSDIENDISNQQQSLDKIEDEINQLKTAQKNAPKGWPANMDETVRSLHDEWYPIFLEKKNIQARIYEIALGGQKDPDKEREAGAMAHKILDLRDQCKNIYYRRDHYLLHKKLPAEPKLIEIPVNEKMWPTTLKNWERYIRDYKSKLKSLPVIEKNQIKIDQFKKQLEKYEWGVAEIKKRLL